MNCSPPGSSVHGILQVRILEWVAISFSRESSQPRDRTQVSCMTESFFTIWATGEAEKQEHSTVVGAVLEKPLKVSWPRRGQFSWLEERRPKGNLGLRLEVKSISTQQDIADSTHQQTLPGPLPFSCSSQSRSQPPGICPPGLSLLKAEPLLLLPPGLASRLSFKVKSSQKSWRGENGRD